MPTKKEIISALSKKRLLVMTRQFGFLGWSVLTKDDIVNRLSRKQSIPTDKILNQLKIAELRQICTKFSLNPGGLKKQTIIDRILGKEGDTKSNEKRPNQSTYKKAPKPPAKPKPKSVRTNKQNNRIIKMPQNNHANSELEKRLWSAADQLRANSSLTAQEYSGPVLGLIFLKFADHRFKMAEKKISKESKGSRRTIGKLDYQDMGVMYLPDQTRYSNLIALPEGSDIGKAINEAMELIEAENQDLKGILPRTYNRFDNPLLIELLKVFNSIPMDIEGDVFGKIYEYFLGKFAMSEGRGGGEFFTPTSIVKLIVNIIEPFHGRIYDPACGSGGMFVQSAKFVEEHRKNPSTEISIYGQESKEANIRIGKMNLAVHGLSGDIRLGNTYYEDFHDSFKKFDFVMANPPFNVNGVDKERIKDDKRYKFGIPRADNANYLWIQDFYSVLNENGRAGFVMANVAGDARQSELAIRKELIESGHVDVVVSVSSNFFYTVTLPVTLWFFDKSKPSERKNKVLFIDARNIYEQIDRAHRDFRPDQLEFLSNIVRMYRGRDVENHLDSADLMNKHFPSGIYQDVKGLCKVATLGDIKKHGWSLNSGRYVGVADLDDDDGDFDLRIQELNSELEGLNIGSRKLEKKISKNLNTLLG